MTEGRWGKTATGDTWHIPAAGRAYCNKRYKLTGIRLTTAQAERWPMTFFCISCRRKAEK